jgi:hypothetical protein
MLDRARRFVAVLFGEGTVSGADPEDLFDISTANVDLDVQGYESTDRAGLCFNQVESVDFDAVVTDVEDLLAASDVDSHTDYRVTDDEYGYKWVTLEDPVFDDLVTLIHVASDTLITSGYEQYLLCAVFAFESDSGVETYWIYNFKRGAWYAFAPRSVGERATDIEADVTDLMDGHLDLEDDDSRQYPLWGIPF